MVAPIIAAALPIVGELLDRFIPDTAARDKAKAEAEMRLLEIAQQAQQSQTDINRIEAASSDRFVSGWRPFIGWVCGMAFAYHFILQPLFAFAIANVGGEVKLPVFDMDTLTTVLIGMLGLGTLRTVDKISRTSK